MQIRNRIPKIGITGKVVTAMFLVVLSTILLIAIYSNSKSKSMMIHQVESELDTKILNVGTTVTNLFIQKGEIVRLLSNIPVITSFLSSNEERENIRLNKDYEWLQDALNGAQENNEHVGLVWLANKEHSYFIANNDYVSDASFNIQNRSWYERASNNAGSSFSSSYIDYATNNVTFSIIHPVTVKGEQLGFLGVDIHLVDLPALLKTFETGGQKLILVSAEGQVLYDSEGMWELSQQAITKNSNLLQFEAEKEVYYTSIHEIEELGWKIGVYVPEKVVLAPLKEYETSILLSWFLALIILLTVLSLVLHYFLKDIPVIVSQINRIEHGELDVKMNINRHDEVGEIAKAVQQMAGQIKTQMKELDFQAQHDSLTGLPNRNFIEKMLQKWMIELDSEAETLAVVFFDLDHFKQVNDSKGHAYGDELLIQVGKRIDKQLPKNSFLGRFGGDEFIILIRENKDNSDQIQTLVQEIHESFFNSFQILGQEVFITTSMGVSLYPNDGQSMKELLVNADTALYQAKENGRNCIYFYTTEMRNVFEREILLKEGLHTAVLNNEFLLHYQPQLDLKTGKTISVEALIRWEHPEWGMISPMDFIPLAEKSGQISSIGDWVINASLQMVKRLIKKHPYIQFVAINVSALQLGEPDFVEKLKERLLFYNISPSLLEIEVTESIFMDFQEDTIQKLQELRELGVHIALDDFGTGYSSLNYLRKMPIDRLKIDRSFIQQIENDPLTQAILKTIVTLGHTLHFKVVAEGVEDSAELKILNDLNFDCIQGYYYSKPLEEAMLFDFLEKSIS